MAVSLDRLIDFHAHILPGADHGSSSVSTTLAQLASASSHGIRRIVATPHFYPNLHNVESFIEKRDESLRLLSSAVSDDSPEIICAAEVLICNGIERLPGLEELFISGTRALLLELPFSDFQPEYCDSVDRLTGSGVDVVLAHADRYATSSIEQLLECGALIQLNADSLATVFKRKVLYDWMERGKVVAIGSDIHGADKRSYATFVRAFEKLPKKYSDKIIFESEKILNRIKN